jgi:hypothetical protein
MWHIWELASSDRDSAFALEKLRYTYVCEDSAFYKRKRRCVVFIICRVLCLGVALSGGARLAVRQQYFL